MSHVTRLTNVRALERSQPIRVVSIPANHVYVRHIRMHGDRVVDLPDPTGRPWWPPERLSASWVQRHRDEFDLFHVHFGFDALHPATLELICEALSRNGKPIVYTAHDLRNPHHLDPTLHEQQMGVWFRWADVVLTLTETARAEIGHRWGRDAHVVAHPHVIPLDELERTRKQVDPPCVGIHYKSLRANMAGPDVLEPVLHAARSRGARVRVDVHRDVMAGSDARTRVLRSALRAASSNEAIELHEHDFFDDDAFVEYLRSLTVSVLPYRFGTHSGWLEACRDLGTHVVAPDCGHYANQGPVWSYHVDPEDGTLDPSTLRAAVARALDAPPGAPSRSWRETQRAEIANFHRRLYERLLANPAPARDWATTSPGRR